MKSIALTALIALMCVVIIPLNAYATAAWSFWIDCKYESVTTFGYSQQVQRMDSNKTSVDIRHTVDGAGASMGFTNLLGIYEDAGAPRPLMDSKWQMPNYVYYHISNLALQQGHYYAPYGRANTKYYDQYEMTTVRIIGQWKAD